jgi:hypothetical protein
VNDADPERTSLVSSAWAVAVTPANSAAPKIHDFTMPSALLRRVIVSIS